jgi:hypothetical protein
MKGEILNFSIQTNSGVISGADGQRYSFNGSNWREATPPVRGVAVDFQTQGSVALEIYRALGSGTSPVSGEKNKTTAGLLAIPARGFRGAQVLSRRYDSGRDHTRNFARGRASHVRCSNICRVGHRHR